MKRVFLFICLCFILLAPSLSLAQQAKWGYYSATNKSDLFPYRKGNLWGYSDSTGKIVIEPRFEGAWFFVGELAFFVKEDSTEYGTTNTKTGIINKQGKVLVEPTEFMDSHIMSETTALVLADSSAYVIDHKGKKNVLPYTILSIGAAIGKIYIRTSEGWYMLDANGGRIAGPLKGYKGMDGYRPGITKAIKEDEKIAYLDSFGKEITGGWKAADRYAGFTQTSTYNQQLRFTDVHDSTYEYHGEPVTIMSDPLFPSIISPVKNGRAILHKEGKPGMLDTLGNIIVPFGKYDTINEFSHGLARCVGNETVSFIDKNGKVVIGPLSYPEVAHFHEGLARIYTGKNFAFIDTTGKIVIKLKGLEGVYDFSEGLCHVIKGDKHGFIDKKGKYVIKPELYYDEVKDFSDGLALVYVNNLYGYIDRSGKQVITLEKYYSSVSSFKNGAAELREDWNSQPVLLGKNGKVLPYMYDEGSEWQYGYRKVREGSLNGIVNTKQELIVPVKYWRASITRNGLIDLGEYDGDEFKHLGYYHPGTKKMLFQD